MGRTDDELRRASRHVAHDIRMLGRAFDRHRVEPLWVELPEELPGHESEVGHELARPLEASPVADLRDQGHGRQRVDAPEAGEPLDLAR